MGEALKPVPGGKGRLPVEVTFRLNTDGDRN